MDTTTAYQLKEANDLFYASQARSFSRTRRHPWPGWADVLEAVGQPSSILDVASGNLRFQKYVDESFRGAPVEHYCIDSCPALVESPTDVVFELFDVVGALLAGRDLESSISAPPCDLCTAFGFMHHIPGAGNRARFLRFLVSKANPGGYAAVSFWQFADDPAREAKARATTERACAKLGIDACALDAGDYLIGWNGLDGVYRYCHSFTDGEVDRLAREIRPMAAPVTRFKADGPSRKMNAYLVLQKSL